VDGHEDLPSDGDEVDAVAITESDRIRRSSRREIDSERRFRRIWVTCLFASLAAQISRLCATGRS
jgi:hypothetical protein